MKRCVRCGETKSREEFYRHAGRSDGLQAFCKSCHVSANRASRLTHPDANRERHRRYTEENAAAERARKAAWREANHEKRRAHQAVRYALKTGRLVRPATCEKCGNAGFRIDAHHEDYGAPLEVLWLCQPCHGVRHAKGVSA